MTGYVSGFIRDGWLDMWVALLELGDWICEWLYYRWVTGYVSGFIIDGWLFMWVALLEKGDKMWVALLEMGDKMCEGFY